MFSKYHHLRTWRPGFFWGMLTLVRAGLTSASQPEVPEDLNDAAPVDLSKSAHVHIDAEQSCCKPCVISESESDSDVFKRPCFLKKLAKSRHGFGAWHGLTGRDGARVEQSFLGFDDMARLRNLAGAVLQPSYLPTSWQDVAFVGFAKFPVKDINEVRNGVPTRVRQEVDTTAIVTQLDERDAIQTQWSRAGIDVLPQIRKGERWSASFLVRLRLRADDRLSINLRPVISAELNCHEWEYFDKQELHHLLTRVFCFPFETPDDWVVEGCDNYYEGVGVFSGKIYSRQRFARRHTETLGPKGWDEVKILVTDSDPQYICLWFDNIK